MFSEFWTMLKKTVLSFIEDEALSRGAAIAFYTVTSIAPVLLIVVAIAGLAFGRDAAQNAISAQLTVSWASKLRTCCNLRWQVPLASRQASWRRCRGGDIDRDCFGDVRRNAIRVECNMENQDA